MSSVNFTAMLVCPTVNGFPVSAIHWLLHLLHSIKYMTLLVWHVVRCCSVIFSPVVVLVTVCLKCPYVLRPVRLVWKRIFVYFFGDLNEQLACCCERTVSNWINVNLLSLLIETSSQLSSSSSNLKLC